MHRCVTKMMILSLIVTKEAPWRKQSSINDGEDRAFAHLANRETTCLPR